MRNNKRTLLMLLIAIALAMNAVPAMAVSHYTPLTLDSTNKVSLIEKLTVTLTGTPFPNVNYVLKTASGITGYSHGGIDYFYAGDITANTSVMPANTTIGTVSFTTADGIGVKTMPKTFNISLDGLKFTEPGIYYWEISKTPTGSASTSVTNNHDTLYLIARINDVSGVLTPTFSINTDLTTSSKRDEIIDTYPANNHSLTLQKLVTGNQGSKDQYFKFDVKITNLDAMIGSSLIVDTVDGPGTPATTLYDEPVNYVNPVSISVVNDGSGHGVANATFWLKHGEDIVIESILDTAKYTINEAQDASDPKYKYEVTHTINGGASITNENTGEQGIGTGANVIYTNTKSSTVPTGLVLQVAAPLAGIMLAGALLTVIVLSKKRKTR